MNKKQATKIFEALSSEVRLDIFKLLVKNGDVGLVAGEISTTLDIPPTNLSFHLKALVQASLLSVTQEGRFQRYKADIPVMLDIVAYLTSECCSNAPSVCESYRNRSKINNVVLPEIKNS